VISFKSREVYFMRTKRSMIKRAMSIDLLVRSYAFSAAFKLAHLALHYKWLVRVFDLCFNLNRES
jgi:hypothetical protein